MALGDTFDLGRVIQTAEAIKGIRRQSENDALQSAYFRQKMQNEQTTFDQQQRQYSAEEQLRNTQIANVAAAEIATDPSAVTRWLPQLKQAGIVDPTFDPNSLSPDLIQQGARNIYERTAAALAAHQAQTAKPTEPTSDVKNYAFYVQQERGSGRQPLSFNDWTTQAKKAGATTVNVSSNVDKSLYGGIAEKRANYLNSLYETAQAAPQALESAQRVRELLARNPYTGAAADYKLALDKSLASVGIDLGGGRIADTETLASTLGQNVLDRARSSGLGAGNGFTDKDRQFLEKVVGGTITLDANTLKRLADLNERSARQSVMKWNKEAKGLKPDMLQQLNMQGEIQLPNAVSDVFSPQPGVPTQHPSGAIVTIHP